MKKVLIIVGIIVGFVVTPILGMAITPTRDLLLGLAPDEKILVLADKIDENRVSSEQSNSKIAELQLIVDGQKAEITNYQQQLKIQSDEIIGIKLGNQSIQVQINNQTECAKIYGENPECQFKEYSSQEGFDNMIKEKFKHPDDEAEEQNIKKRTAIFNNCKIINTKCR